MEIMQEKVPKTLVSNALCDKRGVWDFLTIQGTYHHFMGVSPLYHYLLYLLTAGYYLDDEANVNIDHLKSILSG